MLLREKWDVSSGSVILLHFDEHLDSILWFWTVVTLGCVPAMSTPFTQDVEGRTLHIQILHKVLEDPFCLTRERLLHSDFSDNSLLRVRCVDDLANTAQSHLQGGSFVYSPQKDHLVALMLTSGSTGHANAVCLTHENILESVQYKSLALRTSHCSAFLNFVGLDHVAGLTETHLRNSFDASGEHSS